MTVSYRFAALASATLLALLTGCAAPGSQKSDDGAERNLQLGLRAYDEGQYAESERTLNEALRLQLKAPKDRASAYKTLAFIYCTSGRTGECSTAFKAARAADPGFALSKAEAGHPIWGPVYEHSKY